MFIEPFPLLPNMLKESHVRGKPSQYVFNQFLMRLMLQKSVMWFIKIHLSVTILLQITKENEILITLFIPRLRY